MKTTHINVHYTLTEDAYRAAVREANGPCPRNRTVLVPVGDLTPDAREALLVAIPGSEWRTFAELEQPFLQWPADVAGEPDAAAVSVQLATLAIERNAELAKRRKDEEEARTASARVHAKLVSELTKALDVLDVEFAEVRDACAARAAAEAALLPVGYHAPNELKARVGAFWARVREAEKREGEAEERRVQTWVEQTAESRGRPELARAAREGRQLGGHPKQLIEEILAERVEPLGHPLLTVWYGNVEPRTDVPTARAYQVLDDVTPKKEDLAEGLPFPVEVSEISRIDVAAHGDAVYRTAVVVSCGEASVAVLCEALGEIPTEEEEEDY